jgi:hypothetical protein
MGWWARRAGARAWSAPSRAAFPSSSDERAEPSRARCVNEPQRAEPSRARLGSFPPLVASPWRIIFARRIILSLDTCKHLVFAPPLLGFGRIWAIILEMALLPTCATSSLSLIFSVNFKEKILDL